MAQVYSDADLGLSYPDAQPAVDPSARPLTIHGGPPPAPTLATPIAGSAATMPAGLTPGSALPSPPAAAPAPQPDAAPDAPPQQKVYSDADLGVAPPREAASASDVAQSGATGVEKGAIGLLGLPRAIHDAAKSAADYAVGKIVGKSGAQVAADNAAQDQASGVPTAQVPGYNDIASGLEAVAGPMYQPQSIAGDYAQTAGEFLAGGGTRGLASDALAAAKAAPTIAGKLTGIAGAVAPDLTTNVALPAVASETAGQMTQGTPYEPYARAAGAVIGGGVGAVGRSGVEAGKIGLDALGDYRQPVTAEGQQVMAGQRIANAASDLPAIEKSLGQDGTIVPGSQPTTFQQTGDIGLGQLERQLRNTSPEPFIQRDVDQNSARVDAMNSIQPQGSPADVATRFRAIRDGIDQRGQAAVDAAIPQAQAANDAMGGFGTAEAQGAALRGPVADARAAAKQNENDAWGLVNQTAAVPTSQLVQTANDVMGGVTQSAKPMSGEEARIFNVASNYGDSVPFGEIKDLSSSIGDAVAAAKVAQDTQTVRRLTMLKGAVENTLDHGVENQVAQEQVAVRRGTMAPDDTLEAQMRAKWGLDADASRVNARAGVARTGTDSGGVVGTGTSTNSSGVRAASTPGRSVGQAPGAQGVPPQAPAPAFTQSDVDAYRAAKTATKDRASTFDEGAPGKILAPAGRGGYAMPDAAVPSAVVQDGKPTGALTVRQFMAAGGDPDTLADATAYAIRQKARLGDGTLDPGQVHVWLKRNAEAIAEMPPEVAARFKDAATTQQTVNDAITVKKQALEAFNKSSLARVAGLQDGEDVTKTIGSMLGRGDSVAQMRNLAQATASDPAAREGLRRALVDHMLDRVLTNGTANGNGVAQLKNDSMLGYVRRNGAALRQVFSDKEMGGMAAVSADLDRANKSIVLTKGNKGGPGTAQDLGSSAGDNHSILTKGIMEAAPAMAGKLIGGYPGAMLGWLGAKTIARGRAAGLANVDDLVKEAMLNPALAKSLIAKVPLKADEGTASSLGDQLARLARSTTIGTYNSEPAARAQR